MGRDTEIAPLYKHQNGCQLFGEKGICSCTPELLNDDITVLRLPKIENPLDAIDLSKVAESAAALGIGGKKFDSGKSPVVRGCLRYFPRALLAVADVSAYGAKKYDVPFEDQNWRNVPDGEGRYADAEGRHLLKQAINPTDKESGLRHLQMKAWNALAELELHLTELEKQGIVNFD